MIDGQYPSEGSDAGVPQRDRRAIGDRRQSSRLGAASADPTLDAEGFTRLLSSFGMPLTPDTLAPLLDDLASSAAALLGADVVATRWYDRTRSALVLHRAFGVVSHDLIPPTLTRGELPCGQILDRCEPAVLEVHATTALPHAAALRTAFVVPIIVAHDDLLGSLTIYRRAPWTPTESERRAAGLLVERVSQAALIKRLSEAARAEILARQATEEALRVTESRLRAREADAQQAARSKGEFLAVMSHELRTPLNAILGYTGLLADGITGPLSPAQQHQLERVRGAANHLLALIDDVLTLSRIESGHEELAIVTVDATRLVSDVVAMLEPVAIGRGLRLDLAIPETAVTMRCDVVRFRQVLLNLVSNAIKFTERGSVTVSVNVDAERTTIAVRDTGIGIAPEHLPRIFDSFWRADPTSVARVSGAGLGLAISHRLVRSMSGNLTAESVVGEGSLFVVTLPSS